MSICFFSRRAPSFVPLISSQKHVINGRERGSGCYSIYEGSSHFCDFVLWNLWRQAVCFRVVFTALISNGSHWGVSHISQQLHWTCVVFPLKNDVYFFIKVSYVKNVCVSVWGFDYNVCVYMDGWMDRRTDALDHRHLVRVGVWWIWSSLLCSWIF